MESQIVTSTALTNLSIRYQNPAYVHEKIFPIVKVSKSVGKFYQFGKENFLIDEDRRRPFAGANRIDYDLSTASFNTQEYALEHGIDWKLRETADKPIDLEEAGTFMLTEKILLGKEKRALDLITTSNISNNKTLTAGGSGKNKQWDGSGSDPQGNFQDAISAIQKNANVEPNIVVMNPDVALVLAKHDDVVEQRKYTDPQLINRYGLPNILWGLEVVIASASYNTANRGKTASMSYLLGKKVLFAYVTPNPGLNVKSFGFTFQYQTRKVRKWTEERVKADFIEVSEDYDIQIVDENCAYLLDAVIA